VKTYPNRRTTQPTAPVPGSNLRSVDKVPGSAAKRDELRMKSQPHDPHRAPPTADVVDAGNQIPEGQGFVFSFSFHRTKIRLALGRRWPCGRGWAVENPRSVVDRQRTRTFEASSALMWPCRQVVPTCPPSPSQSVNAGPLAQSIDPVGESGRRASSSHSRRSKGNGVAGGRPAC
jgi:hypothetical protein